MQLKLAEYADLPYVLNFARNFHAVSPFKDFEFDEQKVTDFLMYLVDADNGLVLLLMEDKPVGALVAAVEEVMFGRQKMASELAFWVEPEHRGKDSLKLVDAYEFWARKLGCHIATLSNLEGEYAAPLTKIYARKGFTLAENSFMKVL